MVTRLERPPATLPARDAASHKGTYGTVLVVAGSASMLGAAILASRAALRGGAGLVRTCLPSELRAVFTGAVPGATTIEREAPVAGWLSGISAVVMGPGLTTSESARAMVRDVLAEAAVPVVLDADGLNAIAPLGGPVPGEAPGVITPHPGEAGRLLGWDRDALANDREGAALELAKLSGRVALLKGAGTIVTDGERLFVNRTGNAGMATGGSGDVLSGLLGALLAQGMPCFDAACLAAHVHGEAGDLVAGRSSQTGLIAEDLPDALAEVLRP